MSLNAAITSGIYVRARPEAIDPALREGLSGLGFCLLEPFTGEDARPGALATITALAGGWSRIDVHGDGDVHHPLLSVLNERSLETVACRWDPVHSEFSYVHFRRGSVVESFSGGGSAMRDTRFSSDIRQVPLSEVVDPALFMARSLARIGIGGHPGHTPSVRFRFSPPARRGWLRALLGAAWSGE